MNAKRDPLATRNNILDAAEPLFLATGYADVSLSQIAKAANVTKSLIHHHFGSKDQLWIEVKKRFFGDYLEGQAIQLKDTPASAELLKQSMIAYFHYIRQKPGFVRMNCWMRLEDDTSCADMDRAVVKLGVERIREAQEMGLLRDDISADNILIAFLSAIESWFLNRTRFVSVHFDNLSLEECTSSNLDNAYLNDLISIFFEGLAPKA